MARKPLPQSRPHYPTKSGLVSIAQTICDTVAAYPNRRTYTEKHVELLLHALLKQGYSRVVAQRNAKLPARTGAKRQNQIDFEIGTTNRVSVEFAVRRQVRTKKGAYVPKGHTVSENAAELRKLTNESVSKVRYLLIVDIAGAKSVDTAKLKKQYKAFARSSQFTRMHPVTVIYVHKTTHAVIKC